MPRILAIDYGRKRVGLARTDPDGVLVFPLQTIEQGPEFSARLLAIIRENNPQTIVIGKPVRLNESASALENEIGEFRRFLEKNCAPCEIEFFDESFTSTEAEEIFQDIHGRGGSKRKSARKKEKLDAVAASLLLKAWLAAKSAM